MRIGIIGVLFCFLLAVALPAMAQAPKVNISQLWLIVNPIKPVKYDPFADLMRKDPTINIKPWRPNEENTSARRGLVGAIAEGKGPDLYYCWLHIARMDVDKGLMTPLNQWIGEDTNHNGQIDDAEATKCPEWKRVDPIIRRIITVNGKVYGLPKPNKFRMGITYNRKLVKQAGLDPDNPPRTWDEFFNWCQRLTDPNKDRYALSLTNFGFSWLPWVNCSRDNTLGAPGGVIIQTKISPKTGNSYCFPMETQRFIAPDTKEDLEKVPSVWTYSLRNDAVKRAMGFYWKLRWQPWIRDPKDNSPINLTADDVQRGQIELPGGRIVKFAAQDVIKGVINPKSGTVGFDFFKSFVSGNAAMLAWYLSYERSAYSKMDVSALAVMPFPADSEKGGKPVVQLGQHYAVMTVNAAKRPAKEREKIWQVLKAYAFSTVYDRKIRDMVAAGRAAEVYPDDLRRLGLTAALNKLPKTLRRLNEDMRDGTVLTRTEPIYGNWDACSNMLTKEIIDPIFAEGGEDFDYETALGQLEDKLNFAMAGQ